MPEGAQNVFNGIRYQVFQWNQELYDGSFTIFERVKSNNTVTIIATTTNKKIIVLNEEQPIRGKFISFPGGIIESNEDPLTAAKRELLEETGYASDDMKLLHIEKGIGVDRNDNIYIAKNAIKVQEQHLDPGEKIDVSLMEYEELIKILIYSEDFRHVTLANYIIKMEFDLFTKTKFLNKIGIY